jgi:L-fuculose-phosphate aldolase
MFNLEAIGKVHSPLKNIEDCPLQEQENAPPVEIEIFPRFQEAAKSIKPGDKLILFTWLNLGDRHVLTTHPRNNPAAPLTGVFSTRSPHRPNPIGIHFVQVTKIHTENSFEVSGLEVLDQTPIIDIKSGL